MKCINCVHRDTCTALLKDYNKEKCQKFVARACYNCNYTDTLPLDEPCFSCVKHSHWRDII